MPGELERTAAIDERILSFEITPVDPQIAKELLDTNRHSSKSGFYHGTKAEDTLALHIKRYDWNRSQPSPQYQRAAQSELHEAYGIAAEILSTPPRDAERVGFQVAMTRRRGIEPQIAQKAGAILGLVQVFVALTGQPQSPS